MLQNYEKNKDRLHVTSASSDAHIHMYCKILLQSITIYKITKVNTYGSNKKYKHSYVSCNRYPYRHTERKCAPDVP
jgi:hypothetical protein